MKELGNFFILAVLVVISLLLSVAVGPLYVLVVVGVCISWQLVLIYTEYKKNHPN